MSRELEIEKQAAANAHEFINAESMENIYEKFAYVSNAYRRYLNSVCEYHDRDATPPDDIYESYIYFGEYMEVLATNIANWTMYKEGYDMNNGIWTLKHPLPEAPIKPKKKKFSLFK